MSDPERGQHNLGSLLVLANLSDPDYVERREVEQLRKLASKICFPILAKFDLELTQKHVPGFYVGLAFLPENRRAEVPILRKLFLNHSLGIARDF